MRALDLLARVRLAAWVVVAGAIVLYVFFTTIGSVAPAQVASVTAVAGGLVAIFTIRNLRLANELADRGGDPRLRDARNKARERRGF